MNTQSSGKLPEAPEPYWCKDMDIPNFSVLVEDHETDVVIVGGGITGITTAYLLAKEGVKVTLLEADRLLNGTTGHTTAKLTAQHDLIYDEYMNHFGRTKARLYYEANKDAIQFVKDIINEQKIDCDFSEQDAYLYATTDQYAENIEKEWKAYQQLHIQGELVKEIPFAINVKNALIMKGQAQFHPLKYLSHFVRQLANDNNVRIFEGTTAEDILNLGNKLQVVSRDGKKVTANKVLCCSHFPFYEGTGLYFSRMYADRSYVLAVKAKKDFPGGMYLSVDQPSRSLRSTPWNGENLVLVGGESHKTGQGKNTLEHYQALETFADEVLGIEKILYRWSAQDLITIDKLPYIGAITEDQPNILTATGYRKWGMTNSTVAALMLRDLVLDKNNPYHELYSPSRFYADPSLKHFFKENLDVAKHFIKGKLEFPNTEINDLKNDEGAVIRMNGQRKGVYKDKEGQLHIVDTTCPHLGCEVNWNQGDRTWDCPCHGSRFAYTGEVIEGPSEKPLQKEDYGVLDVLLKDSGY
ncbi:(2Fe-2S)-binding protein [Desulfuribacillus stibiiarsenatis]|uniref:(2Fe-2S)-binding protein n=1 Tax=Desulfuribacillus stibiiarsenatis TaxID=1390249 RepID=A0A1E5L1Z8_9FIRM|nr:FAD-dependent oxidoreductase [Desulfuribacillus stibiiarsenatis]OEH84155.1 (2Fe-2S)-binding protein [Desulfuribacillus stibiiarsenatis]